jgi:hypothetical protein
MLPAQGAARVRTKTTESLPKTPLPGVVCQQWVRCGRPNCRCSRGHAHGPYFYRFWREGGRLRKVYVRPAELERVRERCQARRQYRQDEKAGWDAWRGLLAAVREVEQA